MFFQSKEFLFENKFIPDIMSFNMTEIMEKSDAMRKNIDKEIEKDRNNINKDIKQTKDKIDNDIAKAREKSKSKIEKLLKPVVDDINIEIKNVFEEFIKEKKIDQKEDENIENGEHSINQENKVLSIKVEYRIKILDNEKQSECKKYFDDQRKEKISLDFKKKLDKALESKNLLEGDSKNNTCDISVTVGAKLTINITYTCMNIKTPDGSTSTKSSSSSQKSSSSY